MSAGTIAFLIAAFIVDRMFPKKFPRLYKKLQLPVLIVLSVLVTGYCGFLIYAVYDTLKSGVSRGDKIFFVIFIGVVISVYVVMFVIAWQQWLKERGRKE